LCDVERDIKYRKNPVAESLAEATWLDYDMTCCRYNGAKICHTRSTCAQS